MVKIGVIGAGHLGKIHLKLWKEVSGIELVGFYDQDYEIATLVQDEIGVKAYADFQSLLRDCDAIDIVSPTISHFEYAAATIRSNKHCFIEKPLASNIAEASRLVSLAQEAGSIVQVGHVERFNPAFQAALPYIGRPMFIEAHRLALFNPRGTDVSVVHDLMIHDIDIILSIVKSNIKKVSANAVSVVSDTADIANARIEFDNGSVANLTASRISLKNMRKIRFFQQDAYVSVDFYEKKTEIVKIRPSDKEEGLVIDLGPIKGKKEIYFENPEIPDSNAILEELKAFVSSIQNHSQPPVSIEDGYYAMELASKIMEKIQLSIIS
ncbi:MAG: Gfo/Idh/MocA family oxidoreductase [Bacteroidia bacterium]|nr:Gfo/Idh/MocA family oxidoreductase [Bacteroidia bacterium]